MIQDLGVLTPAPFEAVQMGGADQALVGRPDGIQQQVLAGWIQFCEHIIEKQQRWLTAELRDQLQFGQLEGEHEAALLSG